MNISFIHDLNVQYLLNCTMGSLQFTITVTILILFWGCCCRCYRVLDVFFFFFPILDWFIIVHILTRGNNQKPPQIFTVVNEYKYRWKIILTLTNHLCTMYYVLDNFIRNSLLLLLPDIEASVADIESKGSLIHSWFKLQNMVTW